MDLNAASPPDQRPRRRATLVMFSAGVDSTYTLVKLLRETGDEVFAHHVHFINEEGRHEAEAARARAITRYCAARIRAVNYSETSIDHRGMRWCGFDIMGVGFEAGICAHSFLYARRYGFDRWMIGACKEEGHDEDRFAHVLNVVAANRHPNPPPRFEMLPMVSKAEELAYLGPEIASPAASATMNSSSAVTIPTCVRATALGRRLIASPSLADAATTSSS